MKTIKTLACIATAAAWLFSGCAVPKEDGTRASHFAHVQKTGNQIWAENCTRCHNPRPSTQYSAQQWDIISTHMRLRANLNGEEQRAVRDFMSGT